MRPASMATTLPSFTIHRRWRHGLLRRRHDHHAVHHAHPQRHWVPHGWWQSRSSMSTNGEPHFCIQKFAPRVSTPHIERSRLVLGVTRNLATTLPSVTIPRRWRHGLLRRRHDRYAVHHAHLQPHRVPHGRMQSRSPMPTDGEPHFCTQKFVPRGANFRCATRTNRKVG